MENPNILSKRYATETMNTIFSERNKILLERELWIAVLKAQKKAGIDVSDEIISRYEAAKEKIDFDEIKRIEAITKHDVKARIEAFVKSAGTEEHIHKGMTSRDLTDNVEQLQILAASNLVFGKFISVLRHFVDKSKQYENIILTARTHHQAAQPTLLGRRFAMWAEELLTHLTDFESFIQNYRLRGIKGPVATQFDMLTLLGDKQKLDEFSKELASSLNINQTLDAPGQVYPRSMDFKLISHLAALSSAIENFGKTMRLMAGYEFVTEGFKEGKVGSSAMPHKMNTVNSERLDAFSELIKMYCDGASRLSGAQWEEGDVSCSVMRRVIIPDCFYACDGLLEVSLNLLNDMGMFEKKISEELDLYLPFLATTEILMTAVKKGIGREKAHEIIKKHSTAEVLRLRETKDKNNFLEDLSKDPEFTKYNITLEDLNKIISDKKHFVGNASSQIQAVENKAQVLFNKYPEQAKYEPKDIL